MIRPDYLKKGDRISFVAPARKISKDELINSFIHFMRWRLGFAYNMGIESKDHQFAGTDERRAEELQQWMDDPSVKAIICARGGYGTLRIIDKLDFTKFKKNPKWIVGFSDATVLHSHIHNMGIETIHAPMLINLSKNKLATESLRKALFGEKIDYKIKPHRLNREGKATGEMVGGNLSLLNALSGSVSDIDTNGKILFIEDLDEYLYHIDRMMLSLKRSGKLSNLAGLIVGGMTEMKDNTIRFGKTAEEIILDVVKEYKYPVCFKFPAGHVDKNLAFYLGRKIKMEVGARVELTQE